MNTLERVRALPNDPFEERWACVAAAFGSGDPLDVLTRDVRESASLACRRGHSLSEIAAYVRNLTESDTLDILCDRVGRMHQVRYSGTWLRQAMKAEAAEAVGSPVDIDDVGLFGERSDVLLWSFLALHAAPGDEHGDQ